MCDEQAPLLPVDKKVVARHRPGGRSPRGQVGSSTAFTTRSIAQVAGLCLALCAAAVLSVMVLTDTASVRWLGINSMRKVSIPMIRDIEAEDSRPCSLREISSGLQFGRSPVGSAPGLTLGCGMGQIFMAPRHRKSQYESFACSSEEYLGRLWSTNVRTPNCCALSIPKDEEFPFMPGQKVLMVGNSFMMQLAFAMLDSYDNTVTEVQTGTAAIDGPLECACLSGHLDIISCRKAARQAFFTKPDKNVTPGDAFVEGMVGFPGKTIKATFRNGAELYVMTNHIMMHAPMFGIVSVAGTFGLKTSDFDVIISNDGNGLKFSGRLCKNSVKDTAFKFDEKIEKLFGQAWDARTLSITPIASNPRVSGIMPYDNTYEQLKMSGFTGQLVAVSSKMEDAAISVSKWLPEEALGPSAPFVVKAAPMPMSYVGSEQFPIVKSPLFDSKCSCTLVDGSVQCPAEEQSRLGKGIDMCNGGLGSHACEPGLPDVAARLLLHVMYTPVEALRMAGGASAQAQATLQ